MEVINPGLTAEQRDPRNWTGKSDPAAEIPETGKSLEDEAGTHSMNTAVGGRKALRRGVIGANAKGKACRGAQTDAKCSMPKKKLCLNAGRQKEQTTQVHRGKRKTMGPVRGTWDELITQVARLN